MDISDRLQKVYQALSINQTNFAKEVGISPGNISEMMRGRSKPSADVLIKMYNTYKINISWLLTGAGSMFIETPETAAKVSYQEMLPLLNKLGSLSAEDKEKVVEFIDRLG